MPKLLGSLLEPRDRNFCQFIVEGEKPTTAAIKAGYDSQIAGHMGKYLMTKNAVKALIKDLQVKSQEISLVNNRDIIHRLSLVAFFDSREMLDIAQDPYTTDWSSNAGAAIQSVKVTKTYKKDAEGSELVDVHTEIKSRDTLKALQLLGNHVGLFTDFNQALNTLRNYGLYLANVDNNWVVIDQSQSQLLEGEAEVVDSDTDV